MQPSIYSYNLSAVIGCRIGSLRLVCEHALMLQSQTVQKLESVQRGRCTTAAMSREEGWPVHRPVGT